MSTIDGFHRRSSQVADERAIFLKKMIAGKTIGISVSMSITDYTTSSILHGILFRSENCNPIEACIYDNFLFRLSCSSTSNRIRGVRCKRGYVAELLRMCVCLNVLTLWRQRKMEALQTIAQPYPTSLKTNSSLITNHYCSHYRRINQLNKPVYEINQIATHHSRALYQTVVFCHRPQGG